jgi:hypothetical protein
MAFLEHNFVAVDRGGKSPVDTIGNSHNFVGSDIVTHSPELSS